MESPRPQPTPVPRPHRTSNQGRSDEAHRARGPHPHADLVSVEESVQAGLATEVTENAVALASDNHLKYVPELGLEGSDGRSLRFSDYRLLNKVGEGAMGTVYHAQLIRPKRDVALKVLFTHMARHPKLLERFYREARMMGRFDHPNIVCGFAVGEENGRHYFAMEYIDGQSLQRWLTTLGRLSVGDSLHIVMACARALDYVHRLNLVHRDVKPDNVLIGKNGTIKLTDLGVAKALDDDEMSLTQTGNSVGTPFYMAPEQARNAKDADARSDIYALGCMLYCALTGRPPFTGRTLLELIQAKESGKFLPARRFNPEVPERLDLIIDKMVAKQPRYRYASCAAVMRDLEGLCLASPALSFILPDDSQRPRTASRKPTTLNGDRKTPPEVRLFDIWHVSYRGLGDEIVTREMTTEEVLVLIDDDDFDYQTKAARDPADSFRSLGSYREFERAFLTRVARPAVDDRTTGFRNLYRRLDEEERQRQQESYRYDFHQAAFTWPVLLYWFASRGLIAFVLFLILQWLWVGIRQLF